MSRKLVIYGEQDAQTNADLQQSIENSNIQYAETIKLAANRSDNEKLEVIVDDNDIIEIVFDDDSEWIGHQFDFAEIYSNDQRKQGGSRSANDNSPDSFIIPHELQIGGDRGFSSFIKKQISKISVKSIADDASEIIAKSIDRKILAKTGLFYLQDDFTVGQKFEGTKSDHFLVFFHGTISCTNVGFQDLKDQTKLMSKLRNHYGDNILAFDHWTLSKSPLSNAIDFLKALPNESTIDVITHSRGGLIAEVLAKFDIREFDESALNNDYVKFVEETKHWQEVEDFAKEEKKLLKDEGQTLKTLIELAKEKELKIDKSVRVACPAQGTLILSNRIDHFLNGLLWVIGKGVGGKLNPTYSIVKQFLIEVLANRKNASSFPGLLSMVEESPFQNFINRSLTTSANKLYNIEGAAKYGGSIKQTIFAIFSNLYYWEANDFVVNTRFMSGGVQRSAPIYGRLYSGSEINHFSYFRYSDCISCIEDALIRIPNDYRQLKEFGSEEYDASRGVVIKTARAALFREYRHDNNTLKGNRPIVVLLPGNLASHLYLNDRRIWASWKEMVRGSIVDSTETNDIYKEIKALSVFRDFYKDMVEGLEAADFDVLVHPFDWRRGTKQAAIDLAVLIEKHMSKGVSIQIIAHSMGGLVGKELMISHSELWKRLSGREGFRFVMMGTPWYGSFTAMKALFGQGSMAKMIKKSDLKYNVVETTRAFQSFEGIFELLPCEDESIRTFEQWKEIQNTATRSRILTPMKKEFTKWAKYIAKVKNFVPGDMSKCYYIAGQKHKGTITGYKYIEVSAGKKVVFNEDTVKGDGVVLHAMGIPRELPLENRDVVGVEHNYLMADKENIKGIISLLKGNGFSGRAPIPEYKLESKSRDGRFITSDFKTIIDNRNPFEKLFDLEIRDENTYDEVLTVGVTHNDLGKMQDPVMIGHFKNDGIVSAESSLNRAMEGALAKRHLAKSYPNEIEDNLIIINEDLNPNGAIIVGLGPYESLTEGNLRKTVKKAIINYVFHVTDNHGKNRDLESFSSICSVCIGSNFGGLKIESSLRAITKGIIEANKTLLSLDAQSLIVKHVEFIDYYADMARHAYYKLKELEQVENGVSIRLEGKITNGVGGKKRLPFQRDNAWWPSFTTKVVKEESPNGKKYKVLEFESSGVLARVDVKRNNISLEEINRTLDEIQFQEVFKSNYAKLLFEMLVPSELKDVIRSENNLLWKVDRESGQFPWEMFYDSSVNREPTFVNAGLIRQLLETEGKKDKPTSRSQKALIIGNSIFSSAPNLEKVEVEVKQVENILSRDYAPHLLLNSSSLEIKDELFSGDFQILHVASHGKYVDGEHQESGIVFKDGSIFSSSSLAQIPIIPQFAFINCCHLGKIDPKHELYYRDRHKLAANIGTQLILEGVQAVIVTGWAINDSLANLFAQVFYQNMLNGDYFGDAVKKARKACYIKAPNNPTWAAFQAYGNQWFQFRNNKVYNEFDKDYVTEEEVHIDLENVIINSKRKDSEDGVRADIEQIIVSYTKSGFKSDPRINELVGDAYYEIKDYDEALKYFKGLLDEDDASYTVNALTKFCDLLVIQYLKADSSDREPKQREYIIDSIEYLLKISATRGRLDLALKLYLGIYEFADEHDKKVCCEKIKEFSSKAFRLCERKAISFEISSRYYYYMVLSSSKLAGVVTVQLFEDEIVKFDSLLDEMEEVYPEIKRGIVAKFYCKLVELVLSTDKKKSDFAAEIMEVKNILSSEHALTDEMIKDERMYSAEV